MKVLILSRYEDLGASSRLRTLQYVPQLQSMGMEVTISSLFTNDYLRSLYKSSNWVLSRVVNLRAVISSYVSRLFAIFGSRTFDIIWIEKELFPFLPGSFESLLKMSAVPYVVDYDDAIFHNYDLNSSRIIRACFSRKLQPLLSRAYAVTAGNSYLANSLRKLGADRVLITPTVLDIDRYQARYDQNRNVLRVGWIGSPSSAQYLSIVADPLHEVARKRSIVFITIGAPPMIFPGVPLQQYDWSLDTEATLLENIDVGIMPLRDSPWERGKCGYKLIQYMACGKPVIASPVGINPEIVSESIGRLAASDMEWVDTITKLADQPLIREAMGRSGRASVEQQYSLQVMAPRIASLFEDAVKGRI